MRDKNSRPISSVLEDMPTDAVVKAICDWMAWPYAEPSMRKDASDLYQAIVRASGHHSASDAHDSGRLNWLESLLWSGRIGNGIAIFPTTSLTEHGSVKHVVLQDLGDEDGSNLGEELTGTQLSLREAIDAAMHDDLMARTDSEAKNG